MVPSHPRVSTPTDATSSSDHMPYREISVKCHSSQFRRFGFPGRPNRYCFLIRCMSRSTDVHPFFSSSYAHTYYGQCSFLAKGPNIEGSHVHRSPPFIAEPNPIVCGPLEPRGEQTMIMQRWLPRVTRARKRVECSTKHTISPEVLLYPLFLFLSSDIFSSERAAINHADPF